MDNTIKKFNDRETVAIISPFYSVNKGDFRGFSIARYTNLLSNSFPKFQKIVVFCDTDNNGDSIYQTSDNILIVPTYKFDNNGFFFQIMKNISSFNQIKDILIQFEFSIFGGKKVIPSVVLMLLWLKLMGKNVNFVFHQVVNNLNDLSGHLGISKYSIKSDVLNTLLKFFYRLVGFLVNKVLVHDELLKNRLANHIAINKISVIPHAVGDESVRVISGKEEIASKRYFGFKNQDKVITIYGYRSWYKGTDWLVKTIKELSDLNPQKHFKLLVAGGVSPTLKDTDSYKRFDRKLKYIIKKANGSVKVTGFIPERDVYKVFAASDVVVFPYRARMSASGAFSLAMVYKKPFLLSRHFAEGLGFKIKDAVFDLNTSSFENALTKILKSKNLKENLGLFSENYTKDKNWDKVASMYLKEVKNGNINLDENFIFDEALEAI